MMRSKNRICDIYLSYAEQDVIGLYQLVNDLEELQYKVFIRHGHSDSECWDAMAESLTCVIYLTGDKLTDNVLFEYGAARAWSKPIYCVLADSNILVTHNFLKQVPLYKMSQLDLLGKAIHDVSQPLSEHDRNALIEDYFKLGISVDDYILEPVKADKLNKRFSRHAERPISNEVLLRTLLRMRKAGDLKQAMPAKIPQSQK